MCASSGRSIHSIAGVDGADLSKISSQGRTDMQHSTDYFIPIRDSVTEWVHYRTTSFFAVILHSKMSLDIGSELELIMVV